MTRKIITIPLSHIIFLLLVVISGCSDSSKVKIYERLPQFKECEQFTNYNEVTVCDEKELKKQSIELNAILEESRFRLGRVHNQSDRCTYRKNPSLPASCSVSIIPRRGTFPSMGRGRE